MTCKNELQTTRSFATYNLGALITNNTSWAQVKHFKLPTARPELSCQQGLNATIVTSDLKLASGSSQMNLSEAQQNKG